MCAYYFVIVLVVDCLFGGNDATFYVPKSRRSRFVKWLTKWSKTISTRFRDIMQEWESKMLVRGKQRQRRNVIRRLTKGASRPPPTRRRYTSKPLRQILIWQVLALQAHGNKHAATSSFDTDSAAVGIDNRASGCMSYSRDDFVGPLKPVTRTIKGFGGSQVYDISIGTLKWSWLDDEGVNHTFLIPNSYHVPELTTRLLSPQHWGKTQRGKDKRRLGTGEETTYGACSLFWGDRKYRKTIEVDPYTNVFTFDLAPGYTKYHAFCSEIGIDDTADLDFPVIADSTTVVSDDESSIDGDIDTDIPDQDPIFETRDLPMESDSPPLQELPSCIPVEPTDSEDRQPSNVAAEFLRYHLKFNHCSPRRIQMMAKLGLLPRRLAKCDIPVCSACQFGKASRRPWRQKTVQNLAKVEAATAPGHVVSVDQLVSRTPGLVAQMAGTLTKERYTCATVFVDHYSNLSYVHLQKSTSAKETLEAKTAFERFAATHGVLVKHYHADNGTFAAHEWIRACSQQGQGLSFAGVNAHHTNGKAEVRIRHLQEQARSAMIHAQKRWPEAVNTHLWPYAIRMANDSINQTPWLKDKQGRSPLGIFSGTHVETNPKHWHHFGCPVYVLEDSLQRGKSKPKGGKWKERARIGLYLGRSPQHARNVALILNIKTGRVSPQFHYRVDSMFHTVKNETRQERTKSTWQREAGFTKGDSEGTSPTKVGENGEKSSIDRSTSESNYVPLQQTAKATTPQQPEGGMQPPEGAMPRSEGAKLPNIPEKRPDSQTVAQSSDTGPKQTTTPPAAQQSGTQSAKNTQASRKSTRKSKPPNRLIEVFEAELANQEIPYEIFSLEALFPEEKEEHPLYAFKASADPDTMYYHQAMREPDAEQFRKAMLKEMRSQLENKVLEIVHISQVPEGATLLPAVWQMKRKRDIKTREVYKWKSRLNIDGSRMRYMKDYEQTFAPVASWTTIRLLLTLTLIHKWHTRQLDYVLAFPQAPVERDLYMKIPKGFEMEDCEPNEYVFKLKKNLYGQKQAGRVWNKHLVKKLTKEVGFVQSKVDECVFYKEIGRAHV